MTKQRLGTNLNALLNFTKQPVPLMEDALTSSDAHPSAASFSEFQKIPIEFIVHNQDQPRRDINPESLKELSLSIQKQGVLQPIVVRLQGKERYEIIAGERRWRAAQLAGLTDIPVVLREIDDESALAIALIENIQRENLNPIEEALAFSKLQKNFDLTQQQIAESVGKSRVAVANAIRLLGLHQEVRKMLEDSDLEMGHARSLLPLSTKDQLKIAEQIVTEELSVRQAENLVRILQKKNTKKDLKTNKKIDPNIKKLEEDLSKKIGARVMIQCSAKGKGKITISYNSLDELDGVLSHIG